VLQQRQDQFGRVVARGSKSLREPQHVCGVRDIRSVAVAREELLAAAGELRETYAAVDWSTSLWGSPEG
jgi:hypothetical protein